MKNNLRDFNDGLHKFHLLMQLVVQMDPDSPAMQAKSSPLQTRPIEHPWHSMPVCLKQVAHPHILPSVDCLGDQYDRSTTCMDMLVP